MKQQANTKNKSSKLATKKNFKIVLVVLVILLTLITGLWALLEFGLKDTIKAELIKRIEATASKPDAKLEIGDLGFSLVNLFRLNPVIEISDLHYSGGLAAKKIKIALELLPLIKKELNINSIEINDATLTIKPPRQKEIVITKLNALIKNLKSNEEADLKAWANIYGSKRSVFEFKGKLGPLGLVDNLLAVNVDNPQSDANKNSNSTRVDQQIDKDARRQQKLKISGKANLSLYFSDLPQEVRKKTFGNAFLSPNQNDKVTVSASMNGDLMHDILGSGQAKLDQVRIGKSAARSMKCSATAPFSFRISAIELQKMFYSINSARLILSNSKGQKGELNLAGNFVNDMPSGYTSGSLNGNIRGVDLNELISSFTPTEDTIFGVFTVANFRINLGGVTPDEQMRSVTGSGSISIDNVSSPLIDKLLAVKDLVKSSKQIAVTSRTSTQTGSTTSSTTGSANETQTRLQNGQVAVDLVKNFQEKSSKPITEHVIGKLNSSFNISDSKFNTPDLAIATPIAQINGSGFFNFKPVLNGNDTQPHLNYSLSLAVGKLPRIPIDLKGTAQKPKIKADVQTFAVETGQQLVKQIIYQKYLKATGGQGEVANPPAEIVPMQLLEGLIKKL